MRAAIPMLPPDVQALVRTALGGDGDSIQALGAEPAGRRDLWRGSVPPPAATPPYLFVVRSGQTLTFRSLRELAWARPDLLGVVFDRRWMGERRGQARPGHVGIERRRALPEPSWTRRGFVLASAGTLAKPAAAPGGDLPPPPAASAEQPPSAGVSRHLRPRRRAIALGLGAVLLVGTVAAAGFDRWSWEHWANVPEYTPSGGPSPALPPASPGIVRGEPPPPVLTAPAPTLVRPSPEPHPTRLAGRDPRAAAPAEPESAAAAAVDQCVMPTLPAVAVRSGEVLGAVVGVKVDAESQPPRCFFIVVRGDGTLWVFDSSRVETRAR